MVRTAAAAARTASTNSGAGAPPSPSRRSAPVAIARASFTDASNSSQDSPSASSRFRSGSPPRRAPGDVARERKGILEPAFVESVQALKRGTGTSAVSRRKRGGDFFERVCDTRAQLSRLIADEIERIDREQQPCQHDRDSAADERIDEPLQREVRTRLMQCDDEDRGRCGLASHNGRRRCSRRDDEYNRCREHAPTPATATMAAPNRIPNVTPTITSIACRPRRPRSAPSAMTAAIGAKNGLPWPGICSAISHAAPAASADCAMRPTTGRARRLRARCQRARRSTRG
jgi:hypothetical protein